jgi:hypothetical protein
MSCPLHSLGKHPGGILARSPTSGDESGPLVTPLQMGKTR